MPHRPDDQRYPHLPLLAEQPNPGRRKEPPVAPPPAPDRGGRIRFAAEMRDRIEHLEQDAGRRPTPPAGIQPHLVFRVPLAGKTSPQVTAELFERLGVTVVAIESDRAIIAFRDQVDLSEFRQAVAAYEQGPRVNPQTGELYTSTQWDGLEYIEAQQMTVLRRKHKPKTVSPWGILVCRLPP